jgi:hypothetical protein
MKLREIAYSRSGDKGDINNVCVFPYDESNWAIVRDQLTVEKVREKFGPLVKGAIERYEYPHLKGLNYVMREALGGGCTITLRADPHGKSYANLMLDIDLEC